MLRTRLQPSESRTLRCETRPRRAGLAPGLLLIGVALLLAGCGGGGTTPGAGGGGGELAPTNLTYDDSTALYRTEAAVIPNTPTVTGGAPTAFAVTPALPAGLQMDTDTGVISGTPAAKTPTALYTITASNDAGSAEATVSIEVKWTQAKSLDPQANVSDADIRHFLDRTHFGFMQDKYDAIVTQGLPAFIDSMIAGIGPTPALETQAKALVDDEEFPTEAELAQFWLYMIQHNTNPFQEVLALHWHDHFACSSDVLPQQARTWFFDHIALLRAGGAGSLRDLSLAIARDWSMLDYLDGFLSTSTQPNENFGREWFELFMLGVNNGYDQFDIVEAAKAFSGYRRIYNQNTQQFEVQFFTNFHNPGDKTVLGVLIPGQNTTDDYEAVVDITLAHKAQGEPLTYAARWHAESLLKRFCMENPDPILIDQLAQVFEDNNWQIAPVLKALFLSEAFYSALGKQGMVKSPVEHVIGFIRTTGLLVDVSRHAQDVGLDTRLDRMGNRATQPPVVAGWPEGNEWLHAQGMIDRANAINFVIDSRVVQEALGVDVADLLPTPNATAQEVVDALALRMQVSLTPNERTLLVDYMNTQGDGQGGSVPSPFDATNPTHVDERVRGLLYILGQHPSYMLR